MKNKRVPLWAFGLLATSALLTGCGRKESGPAPSAASPPHEHVAPHGGTPVVLGDEACHLELVVDAATGVMQAYVLDGEMENFVRIKEPAIMVEAMIGGSAKMLELHAVANLATGETVGDTALFEGRADWLKTAEVFDAILRSITVHSTTFHDVKFNFPKGNDKD